jgi:hypothetical protein
MTFAHRSGLMDNLNPRRRLGRTAGEKLGDEFTGAIGRVALNYDDLFGGSWKSLRPDTLQKSRHGARFIVYGDDD